MSCCWDYYSYLLHAVDLSVVPKILSLTGLFVGLVTLLFTELGALAQLPFASTYPDHSSTLAE